MAIVMAEVPWAGVGGRGGQTNTAAPVGLMPDGSPSKATRGERPSAMAAPHPPFHLSRRFLCDGDDKAAELRVYGCVAAAAVVVIHGCATVLVDCRCPSFMVVW